MKKIVLFLFLITIMLINSGCVKSSSPATIDQIPEDQLPQTEEDNK